MTTSLIALTLALTFAAPAEADNFTNDRAYPQRTVTIKAGWRL